MSLLSELVEGTRDMIVGWIQSVPTLCSVIADLFSRFL